MKVVGRILAAADFDLAFAPYIDFEEHEAAGVAPFWVPNRLWRVHGSDCFAAIEIPHLTEDMTQSVWNLRDREQRRSAYEILIQRALPQTMVRRLDGALLVDLWDELELPDVVRNAWAPAYADATETKRVDILAVSPATYAASGQGDPVARIRGYHLLPRSPKPPEKYVTIAEAADALGLTTSLLNRLINDDTFPAHSPSIGQYLVSLRDVHEFQRTQRRTMRPIDQPPEE